MEQYTATDKRKIFVPYASYDTLCNKTMCLNNL